MLTDRLEKKNCQNLSAFIRILFVKFIFLTYFILKIFVCKPKGFDSKSWYYIYKNKSLEYVMLEHLNECSKLNILLVHYH